VPGPAEANLPTALTIALGDTEQHGVAGAANRKDGISLADGGKIGEGKKGKDEVWRRWRDFDEGDVEVSVDVDDFGLKLHAAREQCEERSASPGNMGVRGDDTRVGNERNRSPGYR